MTSQHPPMPAVLRPLATLLLVALLPAVARAQAGAAIDPTGIDLLDATNAAPAFKVTLRTDDRRTQYVEGQSVAFEVLAERDCYITLVTIDAGGDVSLLLPNAWQQRAAVLGNVITRIPSADAGFMIPVLPPHGHTRVRAIATTRPLPLSGVTAQLIEKHKFVALGKLGDDLPRGYQFTDRPLREVLAADQWATAELVITTHKHLPRLQDLRAQALPVDDPNELLMARWRDMGGRRHAEAGAGHDIGDDALPTQLLVIRRAPRQAVVLNPARVLMRTMLGEVQKIDLVQGEHRATTKAQIAMRIRELEAGDDVIAVVPNVRLRIFDDTANAAVTKAAPNSPLRIVQWSLENQENPGVDTGWHRVSDRVKSITPALIGLVDQGINLADPRLAAVAWVNEREVAGTGQDDDGNGFIDDVRGFNFIDDNENLRVGGGAFDHGSFVSSIIAGRVTGADADVVGLLPNGTIIPAVAIATAPQRPEHGTGTWEQVRRAIAYTVAHGAKIVNLSIGASVSVPDLQQLNRDPLWIELERMGVIVVCAAGNTPGGGRNIDQTPVFPGSLPRSNLVTVLAVDPAGRIGRLRDDAGVWRPFSNWGPRTVHLGAPGVLVLGIGPDGEPMLRSGTSYAAPQVAAAAALVWGAQPDWDYRQVIRALLESTRPTDELRDRCLSGGMLDIEDALDWRPRLNDRGAPGVKVIDMGDKPLWLIGQFDPNADWLDEQRHLAELNRQWERRLPLLLEQALAKRRLRTDLAGRELSDEEIRQLIEQGLRYLCDGKLEGLSIARVANDDDDAKSSGQLVLVYRLKKRVGDFMRIVQKKRLRIDRAAPASGRLSADDLDAMFELAADEIARNIMEEIPADLHASRG